MSAPALLRPYAWALWAVAVLFFSLAPATWFLGVTPESSWSLLAAVGHVVEFGLFAVLLCWWGPSWTRGRGGIFLVALAALAFGLLVELLQVFIPYRSFDLRDWAADAAGIAIVLLPYRARTRAAARRRR